MARTKNTRGKLPPIHPGEILREDYLKPLHLSMNRLALALHVPITRISEIDLEVIESRMLPQIEREVQVRESAGLEA